MYRVGFLGQAMSKYDSEEMYLHIFLFPGWCTLSEIKSPVTEETAEEQVIVLSICQWSTVMGKYTQQFWVYSWMERQ